MLGICSTQHRPVAEQYRLQAIKASRADWPREIACLVRKTGSLSPLTSTFNEQLLHEAVCGTSTLEGAGFGSCRRDRARVISPRTLPLLVVTHTQSARFPLSWPATWRWRYGRRVCFRGAIDRPASCDSLPGQRAGFQRASRSPGAIPARRICSLADHSRKASPSAGCCGQAERL